MWPPWLCVLGALLIGCGGAAVAPAAPPARPAAAAVPHSPPAASSSAGQAALICPALVDDRPWARELFPGCSPPPFRAAGVMCVGECPRPCRVDRSGTDEPETATRFSYTGDGLLYDEGEVLPLGVPSGPGPAPAQAERWCTRSGSITRCRMPDRRGDPDTVALATHGEDDRIVSVKVEDRLAVVGYTGGRVTAIRERDDGDHPREDVTAFTYDDRGRLAVAAREGWASSWTTRYHYFGDADRPTRVIEDHDMGDSRSRTTTTFRRDVDGRPLEITRLVENGTTSPKRTIERYAYDCPAPRPFADALEAARIFRDLACMCRGPRCAVRAARDGERWRQGRFDLESYRVPSDGERAALDAVWRELDLCVWANAASSEGGS